MREDPIDRVVWLKAADLHANDYNPNVVVTQELRLLEHAITTYGWLHPLLVSGRDTEIIDGFHRWMLAQECKLIRERYSGHVPVIKLDLSVPDRKMLTIAINRAKGTHVAVRMHAIVRELIDVHGLSRDAVCKGIGASSGEVDLLYQDGVFEARKIADHRYSKAWEPEERP